MDFFQCLIGTVAASILGNALTGKRVIQQIKIFNDGLYFN